MASVLDDILKWRAASPSERFEMWKQARHEAAKLLVGRDMAFIDTVKEHLIYIYHNKRAPKKRRWVAVIHTGEVVSYGHSVMDLEANMRQYHYADPDMYWGVVVVRSPGDGTRVRKGKVDRAN